MESTQNQTEDNIEKNFKFTTKKRGKYQTPSNGGLAKRNPENALKKHHERTTRTKEENYALKKQIQRRDEKIQKHQKDFEETKVALEKQLNMFKSALAEKHHLEAKHEKETKELLEMITILQTKADYWDLERQKKDIQELEVTKDIGLKKKS